MTDTFLLRYNMVPLTIRNKYVKRFYINKTKILSNLNNR